MTLITRSLLLSAVSFLPILLFGQTRYYVKADAVGDNDGSSWVDAFTDLQDALQSANYGDEVWVAQGVYYPTNTANREISFELKNGVKMYGGFIGYEIQLSERDYDNNETKLSGDIGVFNDSLDNSYTVVYMEYVDSTTVLDGFSIMHGRTTNTLQLPITDKKRSGAGLYIQAANSSNEVNPKISNCSFLKNYSFNLGAGAFVNGINGGSVSPIFMNCLFSENLSGAYSNTGTGTGIFIIGGSFHSDWNFIDCKFVKNVSTNGSAGGVGIRLLHGKNNVYFQNCIFDGCFSTSSGGGIDIEDLNGNQLETISIEDCNFENNTSPQGGAINYSGYSALLNINNSTITKNSSLNGSIAIVGKSSVKFSNSYFRDNTNEEGCLFLIGGNIKTINSVFAENKGTLFMLESVTESISGQIENCTFYKNEKSEDAPYFGVINVNGNGLGANLEIDNSIFFGNNKNSSQKLFSLHNCDAIFDYDMFDVTECTTLASPPFTCGPNNLFSAAPLFLDTAAHDYRLHPCSPARNAGSNAAAQAAGLLTDIDGNPRIQEGTVDMGAYETPAFSIGSATVTAQPCAVNGLGTVQLALEWGCPPFFISWSEAAGASGTGLSDTSLTKLQLPPGSYTITITDGRTMAATASFTIAAPVPLTAAIAATAVQCANATGPSTGGTATATPLGGMGPFTYSWGNGQDAPTATGLPPGQATVTVTDANGCTATASAAIGLVGGLQVGTSVLDPFFCHGEHDGVVQVQPLGGTPPFAYLWEGLPWEQSPTLDSIGPGSYSATVTDALGCTGDVQFSFGEPALVMVNVGVQQPACHGGLGTATANASGGTPGFTFLWDTGAGTPTAMLPPGLHSVTATDVNGCEGSTELLVTEPPLLEAFVAAQPQTLCFGEENGQMAALPQGGTPPYTYAWGSGLTPDSLLTDIGPGSYALMLTDANGCTATASATIAEHPPITALLDTIAYASGPLASDGSVTIASVSGGTGSGYVFSWSNGSNGQDLMGVPSGDYTLMVTDGQGCTGSFSFTVEVSSAVEAAQPNPFGAAIVPNPSGRGARARLLLGGNSNGLTVSVFDAKGSLLGSYEAQAEVLDLPTGLAAGSYRVVLRDEKRQALLHWVVE